MSGVLLLGASGTGKTATAIHHACTYRWHHVYVITPDMMSMLSGEERVKVVQKVRGCGMLLRAVA